METVKSKTLLGFLLYMLFPTISIFAQQGQDERVKNIKNNTEYLYAEGEAESWSDAEEEAKKALLEKAVAWLKDKKQIADPIATENTVNNANIIEFDGDKPHIFCYIHQNELSTDYLITEKVVENEEKPNAPSVSSNPPIDAEATKNYAQQGFERTFNPNKKEETKKVEQKPDEQTKQPEQPEQTEHARQPIAQPDIRVAETAGYPQVIRQIINSKNPDELNRSLAQLKEENKIIYGTIKSMTAPEHSYILIFNNDQQIIAILDKGRTDRTNLLTGKPNDRIGNYSGMKAIWFQIFE